MSVKKRWNKYVKHIGKSNIWIFGTMFLFGFFALLATFILMYEKMQLDQNPDADLACNINIVLNCGSVMGSWQASILGFPNTWIGMMTFPIVMVIAALGLSNINLPKWFMRAAQVGYSIGLIMALWLLYQSIFVIQTLCPFCLMMVVSTIIFTAAMTFYNLRENMFDLHKKYNKTVQNYLKKGYFNMAVAGFIVLIIAVILLKFGDALFL